VFVYVYGSHGDVGISDLLWQVSMGDLVYLTFDDGASRHTQKLASITWVIYYPSGQLLVSRGICIDLASNIMVEYSDVINLLSEAISFGIELSVIYLDS